jgi:hypothetical protein
MIRKDAAKINIAICSFGAAICILCALPNLKAHNWFWGRVMILVALVDLFIVFGNAMAREEQ